LTQQAYNSRRCKTRDKTRKKEGTDERNVTAHQPHTREVVATY